MKEIRKTSKKTFVAILGGLFAISALSFVFLKKKNASQEQNSQPIIVDDTFLGWSYALPDSILDALAGSFGKRKPFSITEGLTTETSSRQRQKPIFLKNGDLYDLYGGGREFHPDNNPADRDNRLWIDARLPIDVSSRLKLYGVSTLTLGDVYDDTLVNYTKNYGVGGGLGFSYKLSEIAELNFDFRRIKTIETSDNNQNSTTDSAGFSIQLKF